MKACSNFLCFIPCWAFSTNICHDTKDLLTLSFDKAHDQLCSTVHYALLHGDVQISYELKIRLLNDREEKDEETNTFYQKKNESELLFDEKKWQEEVSESGKAPTFKGLPNPPFYRELTRRILLLTRWHYKCTNLNVSSNSNLSENMEKNGSCRIGYKTLIDSEDLGLTENKNPLNLYYFPQLSQKKTCPSSASKWLQSIQEEGIMELLGMRRTVGTKPLCLPPSKEELQRVSRKPHGSDTNKRTKTLKKKKRPTITICCC